MNCIFDQEAPPSLLKYWIEQRWYVSDGSMMAASVVAAEDEYAADARYAIVRSAGQGCGRRYDMRVSTLTTSVLGSAGLTITGPSPHAATEESVGAGRVSACHVLPSSSERRRTAYCPIGSPLVGCVFSTS